VDLHTAQSIIIQETEDQNGFLYRFTVSGKFYPESWQRLQGAIRAFSELIPDDDAWLDRRVAGDLHYLTEVLTIANEALQASGEVDMHLEAATGAIWEYNHRIFTVPENRNIRD
jgi:hypothetical protein